jgi:hypothetical protein
MHKYTETLTIKRFINADKGTVGTVHDENGGCLGYSIECPWFNNQRGMSCIPEGLYRCIADKTGKYQYWKLLKVDDRDNIEIHVANRPSELNGCIAFGNGWGNLNNELAVFNSKKTLDWLQEKILPDEFNLRIVRA